MSKDDGKRRRSDKTAHLSYEENVCHTYACAIQECLRRKNYDEKKCRKEIERWRQCVVEAKLDSIERASQSSP